MNACSQLCCMPVGSTAVISAVPPGIEALTRLRELGIVPGTKVRMVRKAPLGDPMEICIRGSRLAMRRREAIQIEVLPD
jgi:ferrous iron transport protein A